MKSQDIVILFKLVSLHAKKERDGSSVFGDEDEALFSFRSLERYTGIAKSQISRSLNRMYEVGLAKIGSDMGNPRVNKQALLEFVVYGIRYVFPAKTGELTRGIPTSVAAPVLKDVIKSSGDLIPVWPDANGTKKGLAVEPLHKNVGQAIQGDHLMYDLLALTDAIRIEQVRTRHVAIELLSDLLGDS
ncbi:MAG: transcriptional regulator [Xanthomonadales bacterium]|nr:transcriptional regulator [Xanthomonadales bacterium]